MTVEQTRTKKENNVKQRLININFKFEKDSNYF